MRGMDQLLALQQTDTAIDRLKARKDQLASGEGSRAARREADDAEASLGELRLSVDALARDQQRLEHEIDSLSQKASAEEKRLYDGSIANAKELGSLQHEIENLKRRRSDREDELLGLMDIADLADRYEMAAMYCSILFVMLVSASFLAAIEWLERWLTRG